MGPARVYGCHQAPAPALQRLVARCSAAASRGKQPLQRVHRRTRRKRSAPLLRQGSKQGTALPGGDSGRQACREQAAQVANATYASYGHWAPRGG